MGDIRFEKFYERVERAIDPLEELRLFTESELISALAAASRKGDPYLANVMATELQNRLLLTSAVARAIREGAFTTDMGGRITFVNPAAERWFGRTRADLLGVDVRWICALGLAVDAIVASIRAGEAFTGEAMLVDHEGIHFPVEATVAPIIQHETPMGAVVVFRDATERRTPPSDRPAERP